MPSVRILPINPANVKRVVRELPPGYEVAGIAGTSVPVASWGLGLGSLADPRQCATLADPTGLRDGSAQGVSGSGTGGIVYAVVAATSPGPLILDSALTEQCRQWFMSDGHTTASVELIDPPRIDGVETLGMLSTVTTSVEGSTEIDCRAYTFVAYLGDYYAFTTLVTDPGSTQPPLAADFSADLLVKLMSALRS